MLLRRKTELNEGNAVAVRDDLSIPTRPSQAAAEPAAASVLVTAPATATVPPATDIARPSDWTRAAEPGPRPSNSQARGSGAAARTLIVGREIMLTGDITSCDQLVVEGSLEANLSDCRKVQLAEAGHFKGSAAVEEAEIRGHFEGNLVVRKHLLITATGRLCGTIRYGQIEIERGGQISGDIQAELGSVGGEIGEAATLPSAAE